MEGLANKVRTILEKINIKNPPVRVSKVAEQFNIRVIPYPEHQGSKSGFIVNKNGQVFISVNSDDSKTRQRFTVAHELGHYFMNHNIDYREDGTLPRSIDEEREASEFAAELLMPRDFLKKDFEDKNIELTLPNLAKRYNVSEQAISIRMLKTGLIHKI